MRNVDLQRAMLSGALAVLEIAHASGASAAAAPTAATSVSPSALREKAATLDNAMVAVTGKIKEYQVHNAFFKTVTAYQLCDDACITIIIERDPHLANGQKTTVTGTFHVLLNYYAHKVPDVITVGF